MIMRMKVLLWLALALASAAHAQTPTLKDAVEQAWIRSQQGDLQAARRAELDARERVTGAWFPDSPTVGLDVRRDQPRWSEPFGMQQGSERGKNEWEPALAVPLWLPGQRAAQRRVIDEDREAATARAAADRLALAGEVREALWAAHRGRQNAALAQARLQAAEALEADVARRLRAGELARTDLLLAQSELLTARAALAQARAGERGAMDAYDALVGLRILPPPEPEPPTGDAFDTNPALQAGMEAIAAARARLDYAQTVRRDSPTLAIVPRFDRDVGGGDYRNTVRVGIAIPLDTDVRNAPRIAAASTALAEAQIAAVATRRQLMVQVAQARAALESAEAQAAIATTQQRVALENLELVERAFRYGERGLVDLLRVRTLAREAAVAAELARLDVGLSRARLNQAIGVLP
jgi:outer membrane protein TolC